jgi:holo-[acyl-carrier protein] synthase
MIVGIGLDVVETDRLAGALSGEGADAFQTRVFTPGELAACADRHDRVQALAARFAAKEACLKALGAGLFEAALLQVEIVPQKGGKGAPELRLTGALAERARRRRVRSVHVSLTHEPGVAAAVVILEGTRTRAPSGARSRRGTTTWTLEPLAQGTW